MKDLYNMQKQAKDMKKKLQKTHIQSEVEGVTVTLNAEMDLVNIEISQEAYEMGAGKIEKAIKEAYQKARKKAEQIAAEQMKAIMGDMGGMGGFPGLGK